MIMEFFGKFLGKVMNDLRYSKAKSSRIREIKENIQKYNFYEGSDEEFKEIVKPFWKKYGYNMTNKECYQYYGYTDNKFDPRYIPDYLYYVDFYRYLNDIRYDQFLQNKLYFSHLMPKMNRPKTILKHINGFFLNENDELINREDAISELEKFERIIIKPSNVERGIGVKVLNLKDEFKDSIKLIHEYIRSGDFIIQDLITQSEQMNSFNPTSVNTIRVITLLINNKVEILSTVLRIGAKGAVVDNYSQGGKSLPMDRKTGSLRGIVMCREEIYPFDDENYPYKREVIKGYDKILNLVEMHKNLPYIRIIGWDFAIDENYEPVFIELNAYAGHNQREDGPAYAEFTEDFLKEYIKNNG